MPSSCQVLAIAHRSLEDRAAVLLQNTQTKQYKTKSQLSSRYSSRSQTLTPNYDIYNLLPGSVCRGLKPILHPLWQAL